MSTSREELKPCPFCGVRPLLTHAHKVAFFVHCGNAECHVGCETSAQTADEAVEAWNRRLAATPKAGVDREALKEVLRAKRDDFLSRGITDMTEDEITSEFADSIILSLPSVLGGVDQKETQTTNPESSSTSATATETALERIVRAWDLIVSGQPAAASEFVPQYVADNWAASFATFACDELRKATQCNEQSGKQLSPAWQNLLADAPRNRPFLIATRDPTEQVDGIEYHVAKYIGAEKKTLIIGGAFSFDHSGEVFAWSEIVPPLPQTDTPPSNNAGLVSGGGK